MKKRNWILALSILTFICVAGWGWGNHESSVLFHYKDHAAVDPGDGLYVIFNPFRDREPEKIAASLLELLKTRNCDELRKTNTVVKKVAPNCERETSYPIAGWELANREEQANEIKLHFKATRKNYPKHVYGNIWITMKKQDGHWQPETYEAWY